MNSAAYGTWEMWQLTFKIHLFKVFFEGLVTCEGCFTLYPCRCLHARRREQWWWWRSQEEHSARSLVEMVLTHAEGAGDRNAVQTTVSVNIFFYLFMVYTCMDIFLLWIRQNPTFVDRKNHFMAVPVRHTSQNITVTPSLRPVTCVLLLDMFHKSIQLWSEDTRRGIIYELP